jgi:hypothetical protein
MIAIPLCILGSVLFAWALIETATPRKPLHSPLHKARDGERVGGFVFDHGSACK